jgi:hypothetical protein
MASGFNTDVRVGDRVFHVQTEDRGPARPVIDTTVYQNGRVLHRRTSDYKHFADSSEFDLEGLRFRVEEQHRAVIEDLRSGAIGDGSTPAAAAVAVAVPVAVASPGIHLQLLNPDSWLTARTISLNLEILRQPDQKPETSGRVEAFVEGALDECRHAASTDDQGRVQLQFPVPRLGAGGLALVIRAEAQAGKDEIRFVIRSAQKPASDAAS